MFIAIVQIPMTKRPRDAAIEAARKSAPTYTALGGKGPVEEVLPERNRGWRWGLPVGVGGGGALLVHARLGETHGGSVRCQADGDLLRQSRRGRQRSGQGPRRRRKMSQLMLLSPRGRGT